MKLGTVLALPVLVACGAGSSPPPPPPSPPAAVEDAAPPSAEAPAASAEPAPDPPKPVPPAPQTVETKDECTPVGVDFEKRARPKLKECYAQAKKKDPNLEGTVKIKITVDVKGKIKAVKILENTLGAPVGDCMLSVVKKTPFPEVDKCWDATLTIPITFPTPR